MKWAYGDIFHVLSAFFQSGGEEKEACHICGKRVMHLDKHILANHGEKVRKKDDKNKNLINNLIPRIILHMFIYNT